MDPFGIAPEHEGTTIAPRALFIVAHPDDEVISAGARLPALRDVTIVHITDGAPRDMLDATANGFTEREAYAAARQEELRSALSLAGVAAERLACLGVVDKEASYALPALARDLASLVCALRPSIIVTHPYEGGHPDHDATAFAVHAALALLARDGVEAPEAIEATFYHAHNDTMAMGEFLPSPGHPVATHVLSAAERELKCRMRDCFITQRRLLEQFPLDCERFRRAPRYWFTAPPHEGQLLYERFGWELTGVRWRELAHDALDSLALGEPL